MDTTQILPLLGGLSPQQFMRDYWQKKPLLIRQAIPHFQALLDRSALFSLAEQDEVESRLITKTGELGIVTEAETLEALRERLTRLLPECFGIEGCPVELSLCDAENGEPA